MVRFVKVVNLLIGPETSDSHCWYKFDDLVNSPNVLTVQYNLLPVPLLFSLTNKMIVNDFFLITLFCITTERASFFLFFSNFRVELSLKLKVKHLCSSKLRY